MTISRSACHPGAGQSQAGPTFAGSEQGGEPNAHSAEPWCNRRWRNRLRSSALLVEEVAASDMIGPPFRTDHVGSLPRRAELPRVRVYPERRCPLVVTIESGADLRGAWTRPRIIATEETGRIELSLPPQPAPPAVPRAPPGRSPLAVAAAGICLMVVGVVGIDLAEFVGGAFARGAAWGGVAAAAVAAALVGRFTGSRPSCAGCCACARPNGCGG